MGAPWREHPSWELVDEVTEATGSDVSHLLLDADDQELVETRNSQLATFSLSLVVLDAVERLGVEPSITAGHSLGEYSALTAAGVFSLRDGARVVATRGEAMAAAAADQPGSMAAVLGLDDDLVEVACARVAGDVWVANYNAPGQVVIAGSAEGISAASDAARELGAKRVMAMPVSGAFHTPYMQSARPLLRKALDNAEIRDPSLPVIANVDALPHPRAEDWTDLLVAHLCSPVRWRHTLRHLCNSGITALVELGPGTVLTGMAKRGAADAVATNVSEPEHLDRLLAVLAGDRPPTAAAHDGEHLFATERLVVSPAAGVFRPVPGVQEGLVVQIGELVGHVGEAEVRSAFAGHVMGCLALDGERLTSQQPVLWLRSV